MVALTCAIAIFQHYANRYISDEKKLAVNVACVAALAFAGNALIKTKKLAFIPALLLAIKVVSLFFVKPQPNRPSPSKQKPKNQRAEQLAQIIGKRKFLEIGYKGMSTRVYFFVDNSGMISSIALQRSLLEAFPGKKIDQISLLKGSKELDLTQSINFDLLSKYSLLVVDKE